MRGNLCGRHEPPWRVCRESVRLETEVGAPESCPRPFPYAGLHADRLVCTAGASFSRAVTVRRAAVSPGWGSLSDSVKKVGRNKVLSGFAQAVDGPTIHPGALAGSPQAGPEMPTGHSPAETQRVGHLFMGHCWLGAAFTGGCGVPGAELSCPV